ncbi:MAG: T9SS type A sorting domain-containing protein [Lentimicrobium sp.]|nr:T9SS type A sorting domain-containing protein [Lentimicrobium sp.]
MHKFKMTVQSGPAALEESLNLMKHYLYDHNEGSSVGGVITIGVLNASEEVHLPSESPHSNDFAIYRYTWHGGHAMAIVGYNDEIKYDWGGAGTLNNVQPDGQFRNDIDNNKDGVIDMRDWEIGGFKVANSYGPDHQNHGFIWVMYCFLPYIENEWNLRNEFYALTPMEANTPEVVLKIKLDSQKRNNLKIGCGYSTLANSPSYTGDPSFYTGYSNDGGPLLIQGKDKDENPILGPIELLFDFNHFYKDTDFGKAFLVIDDSATSISELKSYSLVDFRWNEEFELAYDQQNIQLVAGIQKFGIEYDLIPHETPIVDNLTFEANMVSRFNPKVDNNRTLTINNGVRIDMYNSEITIENGSTLLAGNNVTFLGKRGNSRIVIKGEATFGDNLLVKAEDGATIELVFENSATISTISNAYFENADITIACPHVSIEGSTFSAKPDNKFIISRGGKLLSDNNLFTSLNPNLWRGIEVQGNSNVAQPPFTSQGVLVINGGTIENAECGIRTWKPLDGTITPDPNYYGGLIMATDANFVNNIVAVEILPYSFVNYGFFKKCNFYTNAALPDGKYPDYFVKLNGISNISFKGCLFENTYQNEGVSLWGSGIYAYDASVLVDQGCVSNTVPCGAYLKSTFDGLYRGIYALGATSQRNTVVHNSIFKNTFRGMYLGNVDFASIKLNDFEMFVNAPGMVPGIGYGLYMDASTAFAIEENDFHSAGFTREGNGMIINEAGPDNNEVYNNKFRNLEYGSIAQGYNKQRGGLIDGLCYKCNDFINNGTDIRISPRNTWQVTAMDGIAYHQGANIPGNNLAPAGNTFTTTSNLKDISNACNWIIYYRHQNGPASLSPIPADLTTITPVSATTYTKTGACPSRIGTGAEKEEIKMAMQDAEAQAGEVQASLDAIVDGGSTPELQAEVANSIPDEGLVLRNQLLTGSPYLSDTVIKTSIAKEEVLNNAMIRDVLVANPQSAKSAQMVEMLDERTVPMTDEMKNEVLSGQTITSGKENLEATLSSYKHEVWVNFATLCNLYAGDTLHTWQSDTMGVLLAGANTPGTRYQLAFWQLFKGNPSAAQQVMSDTPSEFTLDAVEQALHSRYATLLNELISFENNPEMVLEPGTAIYEALMQLSTSGEDKPAALSRNLLLSAGLTEYEEPIKLDDGLKTMPVYKPGAKVTQSQKLKVYPNPANTFITVSWNAPEQDNTTLVIHDVNGRQVHTRKLQGLHNETIVDITGFVQGTYTVSLSQGGKAIATETLVIAR